MGILITRQIDPGTHDVHIVDSSGQTWVGMVFAEGTAGEFVTEHWVLNQDFEAPSENVSLDVRGVASTAGYASLAAFVAAMGERQEEEEWSNLVYIKAQCTYYDELPDMS